MAGVDDITGEPLVQRKDDEEATVRNRLAVYHALTAPLIDYYTTWSRSQDSRAPQYVKVDGSQPMEEVTREILAALR